MNQYQLQRIARNHYNGNERNPESNALHDGRQRAREARMRATFEALGPNHQAQAPSDEEIAAMPRQQSPNNYGREHRIRLLQTEYHWASTRTFKKARRDVKHDRAAHSVKIEPGTPKHHYFIKVGHYNFQYEDGSIDKTVIGKPHVDYKRQKVKVDRTSVRHMPEPEFSVLEDRLDQVYAELEMTRQTRTGFLW